MNETSFIQIHVRSETVKEQCCNPLSQLVVVLSFFQKSVKMIGASEFPDGKYLIVCVLF